MMPKIYTLPSLLACALIPCLSNAHGWVEFPEARQSICYAEGGFWSAQGKDIPNAACKAAFDVSGPYAFVQRNEVSNTIPDYRNIAAIKARIPDGTLCSAGSKAKAGLDIASKYWQKTKIKPDHHHQFELVFKVTAAHSPSYWEIYLTKPEYDPTKSLRWEDLELIHTENNVPLCNDNKYRMTVTLPAARVGNGILYTRWQRIDPAGEGFYNCSDITITP